MPDIILTSTQAQADKGSVANPDRKPATGAQARAWLIEQLRVLVRQYDRSQAANSVIDAAKAAPIAAGW